MKNKKNVISADSLMETIEKKQKYLNAGYKVLIEMCREEEPIENAILTLCSYINAIKTVIGLITTLLKKQVDGAVMVNNSEVAVIKSYLGLLRYYRNEMSSNFNLSIELH